MLTAEFTPATRHTDSLIRPICSRCGTVTVLVGIETATLTVGAGSPRSGYELHTFQCSKCEHFETAVGQASLNGVKHEIK